MPWHFTKVENVESILRDGLIPQIGELSQRISESPPPNLTAWKGLLPPM